MECPLEKQHVFPTLTRKNKSRWLSISVLLKVLFSLNRLYLGIIYIQYIALTLSDHCMSFDKHIYIPLKTPIEHFHHPQKVPSCPFSLMSQYPPWNPGYPYNFLPALEFHLNGIIQHIHFCGGFFWKHNIFYIHPHGAFQ